jgi:hypothetical protein
MPIQADDDKKFYEKQVTGRDLKTINEIRD